MPDVLSVPIKHAAMVIRNNIQWLEAKMRELPGSMDGDSPEYLATCPLKHSFAKGLYVREITMPAQMLFVTKIHRFSHAVFLLSGDVSIMEEGGPRRVVAPASFITKEGTKRVVFTHTETVWTTVHSTDKMDLKEIEDEIIAKSFEELDNIEGYKDFIVEVST